MDKPIPRLGLYTWPIGKFFWQEQTNPHDVLFGITAQGFSHINISPAYGRGKALELVSKFIQQNGLASDYFISLKLGFSNGFRENSAGSFNTETILNQVNDSLEMLDADGIDLLMVVCPSSESLDQSVELLNTLQSEPSIHHTGLVVDGVDTIEPDSLSGVDVIELPYSIMDEIKYGKQRFSNLKDNFQIVCQDPTYGGLISQHHAEVNEQTLDEEVKRHHPKFTENRVTYIRTLRKIKQYFLDRGFDEVHMDSIAIGWLLKRHESVSVVHGARNANDLANLSQAKQIELTREDCQTIEALLTGAYEEAGEPYFVQPPPALPRHSFERHIYSG